MAAVDPGLRRKDGKTIAVSFSLVEPGAPDRGDRAGVEVFGEVDPTDLGAIPQRSADIERIAGHGD